MVLIPGKYDVGEVSSLFTFSSRFAKKVRVQKHPPKSYESSPTTHVTETSFLHVLDPPDSAADSPTFLGVFLDSNFFGESAAECEYAANFTDVQNMFF